MLREQFLDMRRTVERIDQLPEPRGDLREENVGEAAAGFLRRVRRRDLGGEPALIQLFDDGSKQRFLGFEVVVERLSRQARRFGGLLDRRAPKAMAEKHAHRGVQNAASGLHLTNLTK
jgi:hypothetical protein